MHSTRSLRLLVVAMTFAPAAHAQGTLGIFEGHSDVGRVSRAGTVTFDPALQHYTVSGAGANMWNERDDFHFVWKKLSGNFILSMRAAFVGTGAEAHRKVGWTIRPTLEPNAPHVTAALHGDGLMSLQTRRSMGAATRCHSRWTASSPPPPLMPMAIPPGWPANTRSASSPYFW